MENEIITGLIIAIVSGVFGWSLSQATIGRKVTQSLSEMKSTVEHNTMDCRRAHDDITNVRDEVTARTSSMSSLVEKVLNTADKLIEIVRIQNALLAERAERAKQ